MSTRRGKTVSSPRAKRREESVNRKRRKESGINLREERQSHKKRDTSDQSPLVQPRKGTEQAKLNVSKTKRNARMLPMNKDGRGVVKSANAKEEEDDRYGDSINEFVQGSDGDENDDSSLNEGGCSGQGVAVGRKKSFGNIDESSTDNGSEDSDDDVDERHRGKSSSTNSRTGGGKLKEDKDYDSGSGETNKMSEEGGKERDYRKTLRAKTSARRTMETHGFVSTEKQAIGSVERFARETIFHKIHIPTDANMGHKNFAAMLVFQFLNFDNNNTEDHIRFTTLWTREKGLQKFVARALNERRSRVTRWIGKTLLGDVKNNIESTFGNDDRVTPDQKGWTKLIELRNNKEVMKWIVENAIVYVVGKKEYNKKIGSEVLSKWCNVGDEAMAMTMLENSWTFWCCRYADETTSEHDVPRKWSTWRDDNKKQKKWDPKGTNEFYRWRERVKESRNEDGTDFDNWLLESMRKDGRKQRKNRNLSTEWKDDRATVTVEYDIDEGETMEGWGITEEV